MVKKYAEKNAGLILPITAAPLTVRDMCQAHLPVTITRIPAADGLE